MKDDFRTQPFNSNGAADQRQRILSYLQENERMTTLFARDQLEIPSPAPRVFELRHDYNFNIKTLYRTDETHKGRKHRVAEYVLMSGQFNDEVNNHEI